jgi:uncharacterized protein YggE
MKSKFFLFLLIVVPYFVSAQNEVFKGEHFIEVTGTASEDIDPNEIYFLIRLREFEENKEKVALEKLDKDFINAIKKSGIDTKRLELADAGTQIGKIGKRDKESYREKTYTIKLISGAELQKVLSELQTVKVDYADVTRVSHSDIQKLKLDLKVKALQAAKAKAEYLLKSIGAELGKPLMVRDWENDVQPMYENVMMKAQGGIAGEDDAEPQIGFKKIKLQAQVAAQFEIK